MPCPELKTGTHEKPWRIVIVSQKKKKKNKNVSFGDQVYLKSSHLNMSMTLSKSLTLSEAQVLLHKVRDEGIAGFCVEGLRGFGEMMQGSALYPSASH